MFQRTSAAKNAEAKFRSALYCIVRSIECAEIIYDYARCSVFDRLFDPHCSSPNESRFGGGRRNVLFALNWVPAPAA